MVKAKKAYEKGGKVVAQGADKKYVRREKKQARAVKKGERKRSSEKGTFDVEVDGKSVPVEGKLTTKRKRGNSSVVKFKAKGNGIKIKDKKKMTYDSSGAAVVKKDKKSTKYSKK